jgi:energy-coupling factor transport system substrate-specific component
MHASANAALVLASLVTLAGFGWPFVFEAGAVAESSSHSSDAPWLFVVVLPLLAAIVLAELNAGGIDAKAVALLGMLSAIGGAMRALSPGVAGLEPSFVFIMLGGRVFGRAFGFVQGALTLFIGALITGGVGPWLPFQMMAAGWIGFLSGCLPRVGGRTEVVMLAASGFVFGLLFGALMNLWFWPFVNYGESISFVEGAPAVENLARYLRYYVATSLVWDLGRGISTCVLLLVAGRPLLRALRRVSRLARFDARPEFGRSRS